MATSEKIMKIAQWLNIETSGKTEEEIRKKIVDKVKQQNQPPQSKDGIEYFARTVGRWMGEYEHMKNEITSGLTMEPIQSAVGPTPATEKPKLNKSRINVERTRKVARILGIETSNKPIDEVRKEITKKTGI
jgi:hypothetical protein